MKPNFIFLILFAVFSAFFSSCSSDETFDDEPVVGSYRSSSNNDFSYVRFGFFESLEFADARVLSASVECADKSVISIGDFMLSVDKVNNNRFNATFDNEDGYYNTVHSILDGDYITVIMEIEFMDCDGNVLCRKSVRHELSDNKIVLRPNKTYDFLICLNEYLN